MEDYEKRIKKAIESLAMVISDMGDEIIRLRKQVAGSKDEPTHGDLAAAETLDPYWGEPDFDGEVF